MFCPQVTNTGGHILFPGHHGKSGKIWPHDDVRETMFPVTYFEVGQNIFGNVPAKEYVTLRKSIVQRVEEMVCVNALSPKDAFDVGCSNLDILDLAIFDQASNVRDVHTMITFLFKN